MERGGVVNHPVYATDEQKARARERFFREALERDEKVLLESRLIALWRRLVVRGFPEASARTVADEHADEFIACAEQLADWFTAFANALRKRP
jgi:hypothetical protein